MRSAMLRSASTSAFAVKALQPKRAVSASLTALTSWTSKRSSTA